MPELLVLETGERLQEKTLFLCWRAEMLVPSIIPSSSKVSTNLLTEYGLHPDELKKKKLIRKKSPQSFGIFKSNSITLHEQHTSLCHIVIFIQSIFHSKVLLKDLSELSSCQYLSSFNSETARHRISYYFLLEFLL